MCGIFYCCCLHNCSVSSAEKKYQDQDGLGGDGVCTESPQQSMPRKHGAQERRKENSYHTQEESLLLDDFLKRRGPDVTKIHTLTSANGIKGRMRGCVLHLRGKPTSQPIVDDEGNALLWNGEIFDGIKVEPHENDTQILSSQLSNCSSDKDILTTLEQALGPWSFIYWQAKKQLLWFGRDRFGRRSLLWHLASSQLHAFAISSVAVGDLDYTEIPAVGIFSIDLSSIPKQDCEYQCGNTPSPMPIRMTLYPWLGCRWPDTGTLVTETEPNDLLSALKLNLSPEYISVTLAPRQILQSWIPSMNTDIPEVDPSPINVSSDGNLVRSEEELAKMLEIVLRGNSELRTTAEELIVSLQSAVERRLSCLPPIHGSEMSETQEYVTTSKARVAILFSGGLDSSVLAALADRCLSEDEPIDLLNVAFEQPEPENLHTQQKQKPKKQRKMKKNSKGFEGSNSESEASLIREKSCTATRKDFSTDDRLDREEQGSVLKGDNFASVGGSSCEKEADGISPVDKTCPPILCNNVQSETGISNVERKAGEITLNEKTLTDNVHAPLFDPYDVPDRRTGRVAYAELCKINPRRQWNFVEINITQEELRSQRRSRIGRLIYPLCTVLDDSIGCALWFAARGVGKLATDADHGFDSKAKVILCGMAADEQFAGYSRHRAHFNKFGWAALVSQLQQEMWRISQRNLGRDDRIISDHGKEARFPFLDERFTQFVSRIPVHKRADLTLPRGIGEKLLLRTSAFALGLRLTACQAKRAIQFGSKIAKLDNAKEKGSDVCQRLA